MAEIKKGDAPKPKTAGAGKVKGVPTDKAASGGKGKPPPFGKVKGCG